ncbi:hypothetical protein NE237_005402 [Protea cynaroides]|uniref:Uncharacterized protein n=1 Tax=Protea cynaroides TaxID=273540 RepID=A0A9Q0KKF0_9MAGN|nr:hypothetical protein NE237_005402 [Protea cynaroides]
MSSGGGCGIEDLMRAMKRKRGGGDSTAIKQGMKLAMSIGGIAERQRWRRSWRWVKSLRVVRGLGGGSGKGDGEGGGDGTYWRGFRPGKGGCAGDSSVAKRTAALEGLHRDFRLPLTLDLGLPLMVSQCPTEKAKKNNPAKPNYNSALSFW